MLIQNLNMPKPKWEGAEEPTINNFYTIDNKKVWIKLLIDRAQPQYFKSTEVDINTTWWQVSSGTRMVHQQRQISSGKKNLEWDFQIRKHNLISQIEN